MANASINKHYHDTTINRDTALDHNALAWTEFSNEQTAELALDQLDDFLGNWDPGLSVDVDMVTNVDLVGDVTIKAKVEWPHIWLQVRGGMGVALDVDAYLDSVDGIIDLFWQLKDNWAREAGVLFIKKKKS